MRSEGLCSEPTTESHLMINQLCARGCWESGGFCHREPGWLERATYICRLWVNLLVEERTPETMPRRLLRRHLHTQPTEASILCTLGVGKRAGNLRV